MRDRGMEIFPEEMFKWCAAFDVLLYSDLRWLAWPARSTHARNYPKIALLGRSTAG